MKDHVQNGADHTRYAAIYARVSTEDQGKGFSIPTRLEACRKLAAHEGYAVPESHVLIDEGISGTTLDRLGLQKLRDLVTTRAITAIIVYDPDRLSRSLGQQLLLASDSSSRQRRRRPQQIGKYNYSRGRSPGVIVTRSAGSKPI